MDGTCGAPFDSDLVALARCQRPAGHRPQDWHRYDYPDGNGYVMWQFTDEQRDQWRKRYGVNA